MDTTSTRFFHDFLPGVTPDAIFATLTALSVVIVSGIAQWIYSRCKDNIYLSDLRSLLAEYLKILVQLVDKRIASFEVLSKVSPKTTSDFVYSRVPIPSEFFTQLPQVDLFRAIRKGRRKDKRNRIETYSKVVEALSFLSLEGPTTESQFRDFVSSDKEYYREYSDSSNEILGLYRQYLAQARQAGAKPSDDPLLAELNKVASEWTNLPNKDDIQVVYDCLLMPVKEICVKQQSDTRRVPLLNLITKAHSAKTHRDSLLSVFGQYFTEEVKQLRSKREILNNALVTFSSNGATA